MFNPKKNKTFGKYVSIFDKAKVYHELSVICLSKAKECRAVDENYKTDIWCDIGTEMATKVGDCLREMNEFESELGL